MGIMDLVKKESIHKRTITLSTFPSEKNAIVVEGELIDTRTTEIYVATGEKKPAGVIHHMIIRMLVGPPGLTITDVEVEMLTHPRVECPEIQHSVEAVKGMSIQSGFTANVKAMIGGSKGCAHLTTLLTAMAPAAVQGFYTHVAGKPSKERSPSSRERFLDYITDTCYVWRKDGPLLERLKKEIRS